MNFTDCYEKIDSEFGFILELYGLKLDTQKCKNNGLNSVDYLITSEYSQSTIEHLGNKLLFIEFSNLKAQIDNFNTNPFHYFNGKKINKLKQYFNDSTSKEELCKKLDELLDNGNHQAKSSYMIYAIKNELKDKILSTIFSLNHSISSTNQSITYYVFYKIRNYTDVFALQAIMSDENGVLHSINSTFQESMNIKLIPVQNTEEISNKIKEYFQ